MQTEVKHTTNLSYLDDSDQQALGLFNNLCPSPKHSQQQDQHQLNPQMDQDQSRPLGRLSKLKKQSKKLKKKLKKKQRKMDKQRKMRELIERGEPLEIATPQKKLKKIKRKHQQNGSGNQSAHSHQAGSSEFSSQSQNQDGIQNQLRNLNPDLEEPTPIKRLKKSNRKSKIQEKQGFRIDQLGNQAQFKTEKFKKQYVDDEDYSFDDIHKKGKKRKPKVNVPTNQQIMSNLMEHGGVVQDQGPQIQQGNYDNGLDMLYAMKDKRKGAIKINNKFFSNLDFDIQHEQAAMPPPQSLQLQLKPKTSNNSSSRFTFLSKVETLKKQRGLEANIDVQAYQRKIQQKAKQSMAKAVNTMSQQQFHDQIDLQVRVPTIARGKSADIINNTVFLKSFVRHKTQVPQSPLKETVPLKQRAKRQGISRQQFYKQIHQQNRQRRSKNISEQELKNSFKKTNLGQLEQARKRIQQKRRKQALSQNSQQSQNGQMDSKQDKIQEMIQIEQRICGDIQQQDEALSQGQKNQQQCQEQKKLQEVKFSITVQEQEELNAKQQKQKPQEQRQDQQQNEENQFDQLASASQHPQIQQQDQAEQEEEQPEEEQQNSYAPQQMQVQQQMMPQSKEEDRKEMIQLEQEGIMLRKRKIPQMQPVNTQSPQENMKQTIPTTDGKQLAQEQNQQFTEFRKLRKFAMVIAQKKKIRDQGRKYASQFIEQQAEQGSDNEQHDDLVKNIDYKAEEKEYQGVDLDADLVELIDNAVDINQEDQYQAFRKYLQDIRLKDREEIKKIIRGEFKSRHDDLELQVEEDQRKRQQRMEEVMNWMKKREQEQGQGIYLKPQEKEENSDNSDSQMPYKKQKEQPEEQSDQIPQEQQKAMIQRFIENTLPSAKKQYRPIRTIDLGELPQSVKLQKSNSNKTISLTKLGSKNSGQAKSAKVKKTSSLINQILNRTTISKISQNTFSAKFGRK